MSPSEPFGYFREIVYFSLVHKLLSLIDRHLESVGRTQLVFEINFGPIRAFFFIELSC